VIQFREGQTVRVRGTRSVVTRVAPSLVDPETARLDLRVITGERPGSQFSVIVPIERIEPEAVDPMSLERITSYGRWARFHDAYRLELAPPPGTLFATPQARIAIEEYQRVPAQSALALPRPRLLIADDVGLGKTIEAGLVYLELAARRRARRVIVVAPASICRQWRAELLEKFGIKFDLFTRDRIEEVRRMSDLGANPFTLRPRVIVSLDLAKMDAAFAELRASTWDLAIVDEAHHVALGDDAEPTRNRRFAEWLANATRGLLLLSATPHDGNDATFASLLRLLEQRIVPSGAALQRGAIDPYIVRRLKRDVMKADRRTPLFVPREPVLPLPVRLGPGELALNEAVMNAIRDLREIAKSTSADERVRVEFLATIVRKRLASSRAALAQTIANRRAKVDRNLGVLATRRDLLRRARAGEPLEDDEQAQLELDLHAASIVAAQQRTARARRRGETEADLFDALETSLAALRDVAESKVGVLLKHLRYVWSDDPSENVIVFTEYRDTAESIALTLRAAFNESVLLLHSEVNDREAILARFVAGERLVLVATDVASEGLNLQHRCRTMVHYDLPWNPNRLEQRNGRIDRYGQRRSPRIAYLYSADTYDGELLAILVRKIERQISALGSVGDVLGALQPKRLDELFNRADDTMTPDLRREAESRIDDVLASAVAPPALRDISTQRPQPRFLERPELGAFVVGAVRQCGGEATSDGREVRVERLPLGWRSDDVAARHALPGGPNDLPLLTERTPLTSAAVNAMRELRYDRRQDPRVAAVVRRDVTQPTVVGTFIASIRASEGDLVECLIAYAAVRGGDAFEAAALVDASDAREPAELATQARSTFTEWWHDALGRARDAAIHEAALWHAETAHSHAESARRGRAQLSDWFAAEARVIREEGGMAGFGFAADESPVVKRKIAALEAEYARQRAALDAYADLAAPVVEPLGALLVVPA